MTTDTDINGFLSKYNEPVFSNAVKLREVIFQNLPGITEQIDIPAKMIAYCFGQRYADMVCTLIPSKKGVKLGFHKGVDLPDPDHLLEGKGKISRYVEVRSVNQIYSPALKNLFVSALAAYNVRVSGK